MARFWVLAFCLAACSAQSMGPEQPPQPRVAPEMAPLVWLSGRWQGEHDGASMEESWSEPLGRTMVGTFRVVRDGEPRFYELLTLDVRNGAVTMSIRHFDPGLVAWEEKSGALAYRLASSGGTSATFAVVGKDPVRSIEYRRDGEDLSITLEQEDASKNEVFRFRRMR
jgi:uncharacterized protein DUF6265